MPLGMLARLGIEYGKEINVGTRTSLESSPGCSALSCILYIKTGFRFLSIYHHLIEPPHLRQQPDGITHGRLVKRQRLKTSMRQRYAVTVATDGKPPIAVCHGLARRIDIHRNARYTPPRLNIEHDGRQLGTARNGGYNEQQKQYVTATAHHSINHGSKVKLLCREPTNTACHLQNFCIISNDITQAWALPDAATKNPHNVLKNVHCRDKTVKNADLSSARTLLPLDCRRRL